MVQNHLMQLLCLVAMEPMVSFEADEIRNKKVDVLHAVRAIPRDAVHQCVVRGQYGPGWVGGKKVPGYGEEDGVLPESQTETFVALRLFIDNWRWQGVPFYLRTGKRLTRQASEITIDATLFMRADQVEAAWRLLMPVLDVWAVAPPSDFPNYAAGTWGPEDAQGLLAQGHSWPLPTEVVGRCKKKDRE
jgi:glucose-6-phosphate 1-dehydrogenase